MTNIINLTPHPLNVGGASYPTSGEIARVAVQFTPIVDGFCRQEFGEVEGLPAPQDGVLYAVSAMVFAATDRTDVIAPATGHPDVLRNDKGHIMSAPCWLSK